MVSLYDSEALEFKIEQICTLLPYNSNESTCVSYWRLCVESTSPAGGIPVNFGIWFKRCRLIAVVVTSVVPSI